MDPLYLSLYADTFDEAALQRLLTVLPKEQRSVLLTKLWESLRVYFRPLGLQLENELPWNTCFFLVYLRDLLRHPPSGLVNFRYTREALLPFSDNQFAQLLSIVYNYDLEERCLDERDLINLLFVREGHSKENEEQLLEVTDEDDHHVFHDPSARFELVTYIADPFIFQFYFDSLWTNNLKVLTLNWLDAEIPSLSSLRITHANLTTLPIDLLEDAGLLDLHDLDFSHNAINELPPLYHFSSLKTLNLSHNQLTSFPTYLFYHPSLNTVDLSYNPLGDREDQIPTEDELWEFREYFRKGEPSFVTSMNLNHCQLSRIPTCFYISHEGMFVLNENIDHYHTIPINNLDTLSARYNQLTEFTTAMKQPASLPTVPWYVYDLAYNRLHTFNDIGVIQVAYLDLSHNRFTHLNINTGHFYIDVSFNPLRELELGAPAVNEDEVIFVYDMVIEEPVLLMQHTLL